jgi:hypothetical protein
MHKRKTFVLIALLLIIFLAGCMSETEQYIQGYWYRGNAHFMDQWQFDRGSFSHISEVVQGDPNTTSGHYQVVDLQDDRLTLELYDLDLTFGDERQQIVITLHPDSDTVQIRSQIFDRILP